MPPILSAEQVAQLLDCSAETVAAKTLARELPAVRFGRSWVYPLEALLEHLNNKAREHLQMKDQPEAEAIPAHIVPVAATEIRRGRTRRALPQLPPLKVANG